MFEKNTWHRDHHGDQLDTHRDAKWLQKPTNDLIKKVRSQLAALAIGVAATEGIAAPGAKAHSRQATASDYSFAHVDFDKFVLEAHHFDAFPNKKRDVIALQRFLGVVPANGHLGAKTRAAIAAYKDRAGLPASPVIDQATHEKIASDMIRLQVDAAMESFNGKPVTKFAIAYLLSKSMGLRIDGRHGADVEHVLATAGLEVAPHLLLKWTLGYLLRRDHYEFEESHRDLPARIGQFVAGIEAKYSGFDEKSFIHEVWGGFTVYDVRGKQLWTLATFAGHGTASSDVVAVWGHDHTPSEHEAAAHQVQGAIAGGTRHQGFLTTTLALTPLLEIELLGGYFDAIAYNPLTHAAERTHGVFGDLKGIYTIAPHLKVIAGVWGEKGMLAYGWGFEVETPGGWKLTATYQRAEIEERKPDDRYMLWFSLPLGDAPSHRDAPLPEFAADHKQQTPLKSSKDIKHNDEVVMHVVPSEGMTFADLMPASATDLTYVTVGGNPVEH